MGRNHRNETQIERQLTGFISLVSAIHDQMTPKGSGAPPALSNSRPWGASPAWPGERAKLKAHRAFAATK